MRRLPRSTDDLRGLRAARWIRESTAGQFDRMGPDSQREQQDRAIARFGLVDTGLVWTAAQSGRTVWRSSEMTAMLGAAGRGEFDVLLAGYSDRWQRNLRRTLELLEDHLHPAGVALLMCDRRILSSDPGDWDELVAESTSAERYSRRLAERITDGYAAKFREHADQAGTAPLGFRRRVEPPRVLEVDSDTIGIVVGWFGAYAAGNVSHEELAGRSGVGEEQVRKALGNPLYNGWVRRHRGSDEERRPAPWRAAPPVDDALWARVADVRRLRVRGGLTRAPRGADMLAGLLFCTCERPIRADGTQGRGEGSRRRVHPEPCAAWGSQARYRSLTWEAPIAEQVGGIRLDDRSIARLSAALAEPPARDDVTRARLERDKRDLALAVANGRIDDATYLARVGVVRTQIEELGRRTDAASMDLGMAIAWLRDLGTAWEVANEETRAELVHSIYARIPITGSTFHPVELTADAYAHGLAEVMPETVRVAMASPAGTRGALTTVRIPIVGRWRAVSRSA